MITQNDIPLLEYDDSSPEVIPPDHDWTGGQLPEKCLFAFLGDVVHAYAREHDAKAVETLVTVSHDIKIYVLHEEGCSVVEMECAALAACCRLRGAKFGQLLFTADSLANVHAYDARGFGTSSHEKAFLLGLDILRNYG